MRNQPTFTLQRFMFGLPAGLRRLRLARALGLGVWRTSRHALEFDHGRLVGDIRDRAVLNALVQKRYEDYGYFKLAKNLLHAGGVHLDVGANFGFHTFGLLSEPALRSLLFVMVEANPICCECLDVSQGFYPDVRFRLMPHAAGSAESRLQLVFEMEAVGSGFIRGAAPGATPLTGAGVKEVRCRRLDEALAEAGIENVQLMKMDIEGSEVDALGGAHRFLAEGRVAFIYFEVNGTALQRRQTSAAQLIQQVRDAGYQLFWPHDDLHWLQTVCGREFDRREEKFARLPGPDGLLATVFDPARHILAADAQLDLLAVHPAQKLEIIPG